MKKKVAYISVYLNNKAVLTNKPVEFKIESLEKIKVLNKRVWLLDDTTRKKLSSRQIRERDLINILNKQLPEELFRVIISEQSSELNKVSGQTQSLSLFQYEVKTVEESPAPNIRKRGMRLRNRNQQR